MGPESRLARLSVDPETRFSCQACARCCVAAWTVFVPKEKMLQIKAQPWSDVGRDPETLFEKGSKGLWAVRKKPGTNTCTFLGEDNLCDIHRHWGSESKPKMCQRFPMLSVQSAERVWVTANYGCKSVQERRGELLSEQRADLAATFTAELDGIREEADIGYPVADDRVLGGDELEELVEDLTGSLGQDFFGALAVLAAFVAPDKRPPTPPRRPDSPASIPPQVRLAFALSLYSDAIDTGNFWNRLRGVWTLPRLVAFRHRYTSRLTETTIDMARVFDHAGHLDPSSHDLLLTWLRARLRGRAPLKDVAHFSAGVTRLMLQGDAIIYFARATAGDREINLSDVLKGMEAVELYIASQQVVATLTRLDPRLTGLWQDPRVAWGAAALFAPVQDR